MELWLIVVIAVAVVIASLVNQKKGRPNKDFKYRKHDFFFTKSEAAFFNALTDTISDSHVILAKVRLADLIRPATNKSDKNYYSAFNQISRKHIDFVLLNKKTLNVDYAIELDGAGHNTARSKKNDSFKNETLADCGIKFHRFKVGEKFSAENIRTKLEQPGL